MPTLEIPLPDGRNLEVGQYGDPSGDPVFFFHGLIGSHHQASYIADEARRLGLRVLAPNRPGVGRSAFIARKTALEAVPDVEVVAEALGLPEFSVVGISGGTPYALAVLHLLPSRVRTATVISGMGPMRLRGSLVGMSRSNRMGLEFGSRSPIIATRVFDRWGDLFRTDPERFLARFVAGLVREDRRLFRKGPLAEFFLLDLHEVFGNDFGPVGLAQELSIYRRYAISLSSLPASCPVTLWQGLDDDIVPPAMAWAMVRRLPNREAHFVPGGHFVAVAIASRIVRRLREKIDEAA